MWISSQLLVMIARGLSSLTTFVVHVDKLSVTSDDDSTRGLSSLTTFVVHLTSLVDKLSVTSDESTRGLSSLTTFVVHLTSLWISSQLLVMMIALGGYQV